MGLAGAFGIVVKLKDSWNQVTIMSPEGYLQIDTLTSIFLMIRIYLIQLDET